MLSIRSFWILIIVTAHWSCRVCSTDLDFAKRVYHQQFKYISVQTTSCSSLVSLQLTQSLSPDEVISQSAIVGHSTTVGKFVFDSASLTVCNSSPLDPGRYEFSIAIVINSRLLTASVVIDVLSPVEAACQQQVFGKCSQHCVLSNVSKFGYDCICEEGYIRQSDNQTCLAFDPYPQILVQTSNSLVIQDLLSGNNQLLVSSNHEISDIDYSTALKVAYFVSLNGPDSTILTVSLDPNESSSPQLVNHFPSVTITDIAIDYTTEDIYYIESISCIKVWTMLSSTTREIVNSLDNPRQLLFSSLGRQIIWISGNSIMRISLEEQDGITVIDGIQAFDISVDPVSGKLYCVDNSSIFSVDLVTSIVEVVSNFDDEVAALDVFEIFGYVLFNSGIIKRVNIHTTSEDIVSVVSIEAASDLMVLHPLKQVGHSREVACENCDHACAIVNHQIECVCDRGYKLSSNGYSCYPSEALELVFSSFSTNTGSTVVSVAPARSEVSRLVESRDGRQTMTGLIFGIDLDPKSGTLFYGDRDSSAIWSVSSTRVSNLQDNRTIVVENVTVWDMSFDWLDATLYWTDDRFHVIARKRLDSADVGRYEIIRSGNDLKGIIVDPVNMWLFWIDEQVIWRSNLDGKSPIALINGSEPLALTIDHLMQKLYWSDYSENSVKESNLDGSSQRLLFSNKNFSPFLISVVRNYVVVTSQTNFTYALIKLDDLSVIFIETPTLYHGVSSLSKPSIERIYCLEEGNRCSHFCEINGNVTQCKCPDGYNLLGDEMTCIGIETCSLCSNSSFCYNIGRNISCECPLTDEKCGLDGCEEQCINGICEKNVCSCYPGFIGKYCEQECLPGTFGLNCTGECDCIHGVCDNVNGTCFCYSGYTGPNCDNPICEYSCLNGGTCVAPNECACVETFGGLNCSDRICTATFCLNGGTCVLNDENDELECRCPASTSGPQCQFDNGVVIPIALEVGAPVAAIVVLIMIIAGICLIVFFIYTKCHLPQKKIHSTAIPVELENSTSYYESIRYSSIETPVDR